MKDLSSEMEAIHRDMVMSLSGEERMMMASRMFDAMREMILASLPPGLSDIEIKRALCERLYGDEVDVDAFIASCEATGQTSFTPVQTR